MRRISTESPSLPVQPWLVAAGHAGQVTLPPDHSGLLNTFHTMLRIVAAHEANQYLCEVHSTAQPLPTCLLPFKVPLLKVNVTLCYL